MDLKFVEYKNNVVFIERGYEKEFLYMDNCNKINTILLFSVLRFNKFNVPFPCDINFWQEWIKWYSENTGIEKKITFSGNTLPNSKSPNRAHILYSGGKDSCFAEIKLREKLDRGDIIPQTFIAQAYRPHFFSNTDSYNKQYFSSNYDNIIWHQFPNLRPYLKLEVMFPIISKSNSLLINIEKEIWDNPRAMLNFDIQKYYEMLSNFGITVDSPIKNFDSFEILKFLKDGNFRFEKCNKSLDDFCYECEKCLTYFLLGCNKEVHNFDRYAFIEKRNPDVHTYVEMARRIENYCDANDYPEYRKNYFLSLMEIGKGRMHGNFF